MAFLNIGAGISDFRELRTKNCYVIDKTAFIEELLSQKNNKVTLITRPRRFGKTLTMSMLKEFFDMRAKGKENIFEDLAISHNKKLCSKWQNQYPVISLSLKEISGMTFKDAMNRFAFLVRELCSWFPELENSEKLTNRQRQNFINFQNDTSRDNLPEFLKFFTQLCYLHYEKPVILLIDEYDVPVARAYKNGYYEEMIEFIRHLLGAALKDSPYLQFAVLTGCLRITKESIFTGLNNFVCYGIRETQFSNAIGFTSEEVDSLLKDADLTDKKPLFKEWYDGYTFGNNTEIYCPWDVLLYTSTLQSDNAAEPQPFWNQTSGNDILKAFIENTNFSLQQKMENLMQGGCIEVTLSDQLTYEYLFYSEENFWNLLYLTGYLTKANAEQQDKYGKIPSEGKTLLTIPNKEVWMIYNTTIEEWFKKDIIQKKHTEFQKAFWSGDTKAVADILSKILLKSISYHDYAENFYHAVLLGIFIGFDYSVSSNLECGEGRSDLLIENHETCEGAIIEVKYTKDLKEMPGLCEEALEQIEHEKYYVPLLDNCNTVYCWGITFYKKRCLAYMRKQEIDESLNWTKWNNSN